MSEITLGIIKPEGLERNLTEEIKRRIIAADLEIIELHVRVLSEVEFEVLYGWVVEPDWLHEARRKYLTQNISMILVVSGEAAVEKLLKLRGSSNPASAKSGTIRGDFASDQDYVKLRLEKKIALNVFHAADSESDARRFIKILNRKT